MVAPLKGLTQQEADARLASEGHNDLPSPERHSFLALLGEVMREPMFGLLIGSAALYAVIGDLGDAAVLAAFATVSVSIALVQRGRSEKVLESLRDLTSPRALVVRDGERRRIAGRDVVRGDVMVITEGDRVPADSVLLEGDDVRVDESLLTGESVPVRKRMRKGEESTAATPGGDDLPYLFSGTLVLSGTGVAVVTATGERSEIGKIGRTMHGIEQEQPRLQIQTRRLVLVFAAVGGLLSLAAVILYGLLRGDWLQGVLGGIALGMSMLPEEFPLVLAVFMVMGARRLSRSRVLTRRAAAIETLGAATVLCTDKTGTLTQNTMSVVTVRAAGAEWARPSSPSEIANKPALVSLTDIAAYASDAKAFDPMDRALQSLVVEAGIPRAAATQRVKTYPLRPDRLAVVHVWARGDHLPLLVAVKGAPEAIAELCQMDAAQRSALAASVDDFARKGMRVLAVAEGAHDGAALPDDPARFALVFRGLVALADPLRPSVPAAVKECRSAGIRVIMITGDYPQTARAIAAEAGIADGDVITGDTIQALDTPSLARRLRSVTVCARITPTQKLRIVQALKSNGEVVAMTGDGVNDAPALKAAHIGIAMGGRGTDVAREASALVLLDDDFGSVVRAVRLGRRIFDNLRKAMVYILSVHIPIAGLALLPIVMGWPLLLTPMLIAFLELIIDPACSIVLEAEPEERNVMTRPPRDPHSALLPRPLVIWSVVQGTLALLAAGAVYVGAMNSDMSERDVNALAFVALVAVNLALILASRTFGTSMLAALGRPNATLAWGLAIVVTLLTVAIAWPPARAFLGLGEIAAQGVGLCVTAALAVLACLQVSKRVVGRQLQM